MIKAMIIMKKNISFTIILLSFLILFCEPGFSQEKTMISPYIQLRYFKNTDDQRILQTALTYSKNRMELPIPGMEIFFYKRGDKKELIATVMTDNKGIAKLDLNSDLQLPVDRDGMWPLSSEYRGNDTIEAATSEITVKDVTLEMSLTEVDSIKTISLNAFTIENGKNRPVSGEIVKIYVPRMFSLLPMGEVTLDDTGAGTLEFPSDLPGNKEGILTIIARFEESQTFGNVEKQSEQKWGVPTEYSEPKFHRALWTKTAPKWMIYTLSILLAGVWGHYLFAIISLIRIKLEAKKQAAKEYRL
jgi:hypothetical protein